MTETTMPAAQKRSCSNEEGVHQQEDLNLHTSQNHGHVEDNNEHEQVGEETPKGDVEQVEGNSNHVRNNGGDVWVVDGETLANEEENGSNMSSDEENNNNKKEGFVLVKLSDIRKEVQCPICLGIIRKTRTVMECLHRFCRECIDKSMRMGNNECPACRTHCPSRRSLRDDPNYDALIAAIYPDIDEYEEEELAFQEEERAQNQEIQDAIAQTFRRQIEALSKKRKRSLGTYRRRRNYRSEEEDANGQDVGKETSSADEHCTEVKSRRSKRWRGHPSSAGASGDGHCDENGQDMKRDYIGAPAGLIRSPELLAWGKGGMRSNTRHGSASCGNVKHSCNRIARLTEHLRNLQENDSELDIQVVLVSLDQQKTHVLQHSFLSGKPALSVAQLCQFIALQTSLPPERVEILAAKSPRSCSSMLNQISDSIAFDACKDDLQVLDSEETLAGLRAACNFARGCLMLAYRQKQTK